MNKIALLNYTSLHKVLPGSVCPFIEYDHASVLSGQHFSYQVLYRSEFSEGLSNLMVELSVESELSEFIKIYKVEDVPCANPKHPTVKDDDYIVNAPSVIPDPLFPLENGAKVLSNPLFWSSLWIDVKIPEDIKEGIYPIKVTLDPKSDIAPASAITFNLKVLNAKLEKSGKIYTQWFYADCIADAHKAPIFSEEHWALIDSYMKEAGENGVNMLLTPVLTLALDTEIGGERPTVQLVDICKDGDKYTFGYEKFDRWVSLMKKHGIDYIEISHFFTQWGAEHAPKVVAKEEGSLKKIFGWETVSYGEEYENFLNQILPSLRAHLKELGMEENTYFHISDEPYGEHLETYKKVTAIMKRHLSGCHIVDALSNVEFFRQKAIDEPIAATSSIEDFLSENIDNLWCYYCCSQQEKVANSFIAMPSYRNRILGVQMYMNKIKGFLHWGFNFYYSERSRFFVDPYRNTNSCSVGFPSGDGFLVYPGEKGAIPSLRLKVFRDMTEDVSSLYQLERLIGRDEVIKIIDDLSGMKIKFDSYPKNNDFLLTLRNIVNEKIAELS